MFRTIYGVLATLALSTGLVKRSRWKWIIAAIAFTGLYSSILRHCTPYSILGISTAEKIRLQCRKFILMNNTSENIYSLVF